MKGFSLVGSDTIRNSQLNSSTAKHSFCFPKAERFKSPPPKYMLCHASCPIAFYSNSCELSKRKTSFGYGKKQDFTINTANSPACNMYNIHSAFEKDPRKGKSIGVSREVSDERNEDVTRKRDHQYGCAESSRTSEV